MGWEEAGHSLNLGHMHITFCFVTSMGVRKEEKRRAQEGRGEAKGKTKAIKSANTPKVKTCTLLPSDLQ